MDEIQKHGMSSDIENVLIAGDLSKLTAQQRVEYYRAVCKSLGLNPLTKPFGYITLNGKLTLYALKDATEQLRSTRGVSITKIEKEFRDDLYIVTAHASDKNGRSDVSTGSVSIAGLRGDALANAIMKAETKAKRRVTLSICGLGMLDETEISTIPDARIVDVEQEPLTYEQAAATKTPKGARLDSLNIEQLQYLIERAHPQLAEAARVVLEHDFNIAADEQKEEP